MAAPPPYWSVIWLHCAKCNHDWDDWQPGGVPIDTWVAHVKTYRCPECGARARKIGIRTKPLEET